MGALQQIRSELANLLRPDVRAQLQTAKSGSTVTPFQDALNPMLKAASTNGANATSSSTPSSSTTAPNALGENTFLQLLVQQMQYQDPLSPMDNTQMIAQLAQFSSLEQMQNLNQSFQNFSGNLDQLNFISASSLVGKHVTGLDVNGAPVSGVVNSVRMNNSIVYLTVGSQQMSMAGVLTLSAS